MISQKLHSSYFWDILSVAHPEINSS